MDRIDTLIANATVRTLDPACPLATQVAIRGGRIVGVGRDGEFDALVDAQTRRIDLRGRIVTPGFHDSHMHVLPFGVFLGRADLSPGAGVRDASALARALREWADRNPTSEWALGSGYDQNAFPGARHPTRRDLDALLPGLPACAQHASGHAAVANSEALARAGVTRSTPDPPGGTIVRDAAGEPTGLLLETAVDRVMACVPQPSLAELTAAALRAGRELLRVGVTSASDMCLSWIGGAQAIPAYRAAVEQGYVVRTGLCPSLADFGPPAAVPDRAAFERDSGLPVGDTLRLGPAKLFADGALTTRTAAVREPFADGAGEGRLMHEPEELTAYVHAAHARGWQVATHAIGDRAIALALEAYATVEDGAPSRERRHRVEHAMLLDDGTMDRFAEVGAIPTMQPEFLARLGDAYVLALGEARAARLNPYRSLRDRGVPVAFGSDCPVVPGRPLDGMRAAVARRTPSGRVLGAEQALTPFDALWNYTVGAAHAVFQEAATGRIKPGMWADLAVLTHDPATVDGLEAAEVVAAFVAGRIVSGEDALE